MEDCISLPGLNSSKPFKCVAVLQRKKVSHLYNIQYTTDTELEFGPKNRTNDQLGTKYGLQLQFSWYWNINKDTITAQTTCSYILSFANTDDSASQATTRVPCG